MMDPIRQTTGHPIRVICAVLEVPRSSSYHAAQPIATQRSDGEPGPLLKPSSGSTAAVAATGGSAPN